MPSSNVILAAIFALMLSASKVVGQVPPGKPADEAIALAAEFAQDIRPFLNRYCLRCHNAKTAESGIRLDRLNGKLEDRHLKLWEVMREQIAESLMPPEDERQPTDNERRPLVEWIDRALHEARSRPVENNGSVRRLTVSQYRNTLRDLLGIKEDLTDVLPPDAVSKDGFTNNSQSMQLSPLQVEAYFDIAAKALDQCIVEEGSRPTIQNFRMHLGKSINPEPFPEKLILGANNRLLDNDEFVIEELSPSKPFDYEPLRMRKKYRFHEGYAGNSTVRGWRDYDSIYHSVFACVRGTPGYPKGKPYETVPGGLLLRPSLPSLNMTGEEGRYGPLPNFKVSLRELPDHGNFRVTVRAAKYNDGLLLDPGSEAHPRNSELAVVADHPRDGTKIDIKQAGIYQVDLHHGLPEAVTPDRSRLSEDLIGSWSFDEDAISKVEDHELIGQLTAGTEFVDSPLGKAISVDGKSGSVVVPRDESMNVGTGDFTIAAWIHPRRLRQGGIFCLGKYSWTHGWYFDMPNNKGVLRIETVDPNNASNGTVASASGAIRANTWQHVAAVVRRGTKKTKLYINGYVVASGTIAATNLDNPKVDLHIGRIQESKLFDGMIDDVRFYRRALEVAELQALIEPAKQFVQPPPTDKRPQITLRLEERFFSGTLHQPAFLAVRLPAGRLTVEAESSGKQPLRQVVFSRLEQSNVVAQQFATFEKRVPRLGVHLGLRRDCGSTLGSVGAAQTVSSLQIQEYVFAGAINDFPSPDVQKENDNYLAGVREIGVRSECTDGRDMPRLHVQSVEFEGPFYETWPPAEHRRIFVDSDRDRQSEAYATEVIAAFATRAFRRPVTDSELAAFVKVWRNAFSATGSFRHSIKDSLLVVLTSPQFLFLIENSATPEPEDLDSFELASKLSYFLWNAAPDKQLLSLAAGNKLRQSLDEQVDRLVEDPRFEQFTEQFASQWLSLDKFDVVEIDWALYPRLTRHAQHELRREPIEFLQHLFRHNLSVHNLLQSDFLVANEVVARYYDLQVQPESGFGFVPVRHGNEQLGGLFSQAAIMAGLSDGRESNPVKRGAWLARKIIAEPPDDPPPNVPALAEDTTDLTLRERLEKHRNQKGCVKCHEGIDPWGVPFEEIDAGGRLKTETVDARSRLPDDTQVRNLNELRAYLANDRIDQVAFSTLKHLTSYAIGRSLTYNEIELLKVAALELKSKDYRMKDMIHFVVNSDLFLKK